MSSTTPTPATVTKVAANRVESTPMNGSNTRSPNEAPGGAPPLR